MEEHFPNTDAAAPKSDASSRPTHEQAHERARELAAIEGRPPSEVSMTDYMQAKRELTGESEVERQDAILDSIELPERWETVPESTGVQMPEAPNEDEDEDGLSVTDQLAEEGVEKATRDRMHESAHETKIADQETI